MPLKNAVLLFCLTRKCILANASFLTIAIPGTPLWPAHCVRPLRSGISKLGGYALLLGQSTIALFALPGMVNENLEALATSCCAVTPSIVSTATAVQVPDTLLLSHMFHLLRLRCIFVFPFLLCCAIRA